MRDPLYLSRLSREVPYSRWRASYRDLSFGRGKAFTCKYIDDYHVLVGNNSFHICEFAEILERRGAHVYPFPEKHMIWSNIDLDLKDWEGLREKHPEYTEEQLTEEM